MQIFQPQFAYLHVSNDLLFDYLKLLFGLVCYIYKMRFEDDHAGSVGTAVEESLHLLGDNTKCHEGW